VSVYILVGLGFQTMTKEFIFSRYQMQIL